MKAKLVEFKFYMRVVVPDQATEDKIKDVAAENMMVRLNAEMYTELMCNCVAVTDDIEFPFDPKEDKPGSFGYHGKEDPDEEHQATGYSFQIIIY